MPCPHTFPINSPPVCYTNCNSVRNSILVRHIAKKKKKNHIPKLTLLNSFQALCFLLRIAMCAGGGMGYAGWVVFYFILDMKLT